MRIKNVKNFQKLEVPYLSNTGIVPQDPFSTHKSRKEKVFKCLYDQYKNGGRGLSQNEIKTQTGLSQPTVYRALTDLQKNPYTRGNYKYNTIVVDGLYYIAKEIDEDRLRELYENTIATLADKKAFTNSRAIEINNYVISFEVEKSCCAPAIKALKNFFRSTYIYDIVAHSNGIYIILKDGKSPQQKDELKQRLCEFYTLVVERIEKNKKLDKISFTKAGKA